MTNPRQYPGAGYTADWNLGADGWKDANDANWLLASALHSGNVKSRTTTLPGTGLAGDIYIVPTADPNGDELAVWDGDPGFEQWNYFPARVGWSFYVLDESERVQFSSGAWSIFSSGGGGGGGGFRGPLLHVRDEKPDDTNGGTSIADTWLARDLNQTKTNEIADASLSANQITLPAGTYFLSANSPLHSPNRGKCRWQNVTDGSTVIEGGNGFAAESTDNEDFRGWVQGQFTIPDQKTFELQYIVQTGTLDVGLGVPNGGNITPILTEVYSEVLIWQFLDTGVFYAVEVLATGTDAGASVAGRNIRAFNFDLENTIAGASRTGAVFTLPPGLYECRAHAPAFDSDGHGLRLFDIDSAADLVKGGNEHSGAQKQNTANLDGPFTLSVETQVRLEHYCENGKAGTGLGQAINEAGELERYAGIRFIKLS